MADSIHVDPALAPELVDFWARKCRDLTEQLKEAKAALEQPSNASTSSLYDVLHGIRLELVKSNETEKELRGLLQASITGEREARNKLSKALRDVSDMKSKLERVDNERTALLTQVQNFRAQSASLSADSDRIRRDAIHTMFPHVNFLEQSFLPQVFHGQDIPTIVDILTPTGVLAKYRLYLLPKPPSCMPLRVQYCGSHGYWFAPTTIPPDEFELIVEGRVGEWTYLGRYLTNAIPGHEMRLTEWLALDEQTKLSYCARLAHLNSVHPSTSSSSPGQTSPMEIKRRYDTGEWIVPCYSLRCVGFSKDLYSVLIDKLGGPRTVNESRATTPRVPSYRETSAPSVLQTNAANNRGVAAGGGKRSLSASGSVGEESGENRAVKRGKIEPL